MTHQQTDPWAPGMRAVDVPITPGGSPSPFTDLDNVIELDAVDVLEITELSPADDSFVGKRIPRDGNVVPYPSVKLWHQAVARIPALFDYLQQARRRNVCLIRGSPANPARKNTRRWIAGGERGDHGFVDEPTKLHFFDIDGAIGNWCDDPEAAVRHVVAQLGKPWTSASYVWFFSAGHGLKMETVEIGDEKKKLWCGTIDDSRIRVRLAFITDRALYWREAAMLTDIVKAASGLPLDEAICRTVQPNYIARPRWDGHGVADVLGNIKTIGLQGGSTGITTLKVAAAVPVTTTTTATVTVPDDLAHRARWAQAQGHGVVIADHPDAITAVQAIGSDGRIRQHMMAAIVHLLKANPPADHVSAIDHGLALADQLQAMVAQHSETITAQLATHGRSWGDIAHYVAGMADWARWLIERPGALKRRTIRLTHEQPSEGAQQPGVQPEAQAIFDRVAGVFEAFYELRLSLFTGAPEADDNNATLLIAPTGSRKSTEMRKTAVRLVTEHRDRTIDQSVVILVPRHELGTEQIQALHHEHPDKNFTAAIWRGRHAADPEFIGPQQPGKTKLMCWRSEEAKALEGVLLDVESHLCKRGRGAGAVTCPLCFQCGAQRQRQVRADIWLGAHELLAHPPPKAFGYVARVMVDETPLDAFLFGVDAVADKDKFTLDLDALLTPPKWGSYFSLSSEILMDGRSALYRVLDGLQVPIDKHRGVPVPQQDLREFVEGAPAPVQTDNSFERVNAMMTNGARYNTGELIAFEWRDKVEPAVRPTMTASEVEEQLIDAADNPQIKKLVTLWGLLGRGQHGHNGRIQVHRGGHGRMIRMTGLREIAEGWQVPALICDATGDAELLRAIWPNLESDMNEWQQLPRPASVRIFQTVDRAISKWAVAIEGEGKELARRERAARRLYAAVHAKALEYGGADVGVVVYKSTEDWIRANCHVPPWLKFYHHGATEGTNALSNVRALFVVGRPLASPEAVTRMTEALFGAYVAEREYQTIAKGGRIPIVPDAQGNNAVLVDAWKHPDPRAERMRRQVTEAGLIQTTGRARAGLRDEDSPLDINLWTDVALPEFGPVEPVLWDEVAVGLEEMMFAAGGIWLKNVTHAAKAYPDLFTASTLQKSRHRAQAQSASGGAVVGSVRSRDMPNSISIRDVLALQVLYRLPGQGNRYWHAVSLLGPNQTKAWLEERLGPLVRFKVLDGTDQADEAAE